MKPVSLLLCTLLALGVIACRSSTAKKDAPENRETARLGAVEPLAQPQPKERVMDEELDKT